MQTSVTSFVVDSAKASLRGPASYKAWLGVLVLGLLPGTFAYLKQLDEGLAVTGMSDQDLRDLFAFINADEAPPAE